MADQIFDGGKTIGGVTGSIGFTIQEAGAALIPTNLWITIYDQETGTSIKTRTALTPVSNYVDLQGVLTYNISATESELVNTKTVPLDEVHRYLFEWDWLSTTRVGKKLLSRLVQAETKQPDA